MTESPFGPVRKWPPTRVYLSDADYERLHTEALVLEFNREIDRALAMVGPNPLTHPANLRQLDDAPFVTDRGGVKGWRVLACVLAVSGALVIYSVWRLTSWVVSL